VHCGVWPPEPSVETADPWRLVVVTVCFAGFTPTAGRIGELLPVLSMAISRNYQEHFVSLNVCCAYSPCSLYPPEVSCRRVECCPRHPLTTEWIQLSSYQALLEKAYAAPRVSFSATHRTTASSPIFVLSSLWPPLDYAAPAAECLNMKLLCKLVTRQRTTSRKIRIYKEAKASTKMTFTATRYHQLITS
jgi:hypothetical protein